MSSQNTSLSFLCYRAVSHCVGVLVAKSCLTLWDPMDCSLPGSSVHGILQKRILEWVAVPFSRASSQLMDWNQVSCIAGRFFTIWATREAQVPTYQPSNSELSKTWMCIPATSGVSVIAACSSSPVADNSSALPSRSSCPSSSQELFLPLH